MLLNVFIHPHHPHFGLEAIPRVLALFGLAGAVVLPRAPRDWPTPFWQDEIFMKKARGFED